MVSFEKFFVTVQEHFNGDCLPFNCLPWRVRNDAVFIQSRLDRTNALVVFHFSCWICH